MFLDKQTKLVHKTIKPAPEAIKHLQQSNQTSTGGNQTSNEQLLNYTNEAIKAQKGGHKTDLTDNLKKLQEALIKSSGKQVVIVPDTSSSDKSSGSSSSGSYSSGSSSSGY